MSVATASSGPLTRYRLPVYTHERGAFNGVRDAKVLIYFPHGLGDRAQFARVLPMLEPSNRYWMTRYGDDCIALVDRCTGAQPVYLGVNGTQNGDGAAFENRHFGLEYTRLDGSPRDVVLPDSLLEFCDASRSMRYSGRRSPRSAAGSRIRTIRRRVTSYGISSRRTV